MDRMLATAAVARWFVTLPRRLYILDPGKISSQHFSNVVSAHIVAKQISLWQIKLFDCNSGGHGHRDKQMQSELDRWKARKTQEANQWSKDNPLCWCCCELLQSDVTHSDHKWQIVWNPWWKTADSWVDLILFMGKRDTSIVVGRILVRFNRAHGNYELDVYFFSHLFFLSPTCC